MIRAIRRSLRQDVDGCELVLTIRDVDLPEFLRMAPQLGDAVCVGPYEEAALNYIGNAVPAALAARSNVEVAEATMRPPTQSIAPTGESFGAVMQPGASREAIEARLLCDNPWFQGFARKRLGDKAGANDLENAIKFLSAATLNGMTWDSAAPVKYAAMLVEYRAWCASKGYK